MSPRVKVELDGASFEEEVEVWEVEGTGTWRTDGDVPDERGVLHRLTAVGRTRGDSLGTWVGARVDREDGVCGKRVKK